MKRICFSFNLLFFIGLIASCGSLGGVAAGAGLCDEDNGGCDPNVTCEVNNQGLVRCGPCPDGFEGRGNTQCNDIDECVGDITLCDENAFCENRPGDYICICNDGYAGDGETCFDIDECIEAR